MVAALRERGTFSTTSLRWMNTKPGTCFNYDDQSTRFAHQNEQLIPGSLVSPGDSENQSPGADGQGEPRSFWGNRNLFI